MQITITDFNHSKIAEIISDDVIINQTQDALDLMANCTYQDAYKIIVHSHHLAPAFFDLKSGIAGDILQKFSTYNVQLAIVGNFTEVESKSLRDFIRESNRYGRINFVENMEEAKKKLVRI